jgi:hypothetical protein
MKFNIVERCAVLALLVFTPVVTVTILVCSLAVALLFPQGDGFDGFWKTLTTYQFGGMQFMGAVWYLLLAAALLSRFVRWLLSKQVQH